MYKHKHQSILYLIASFQKISLQDSTLKFIYLALVLFLGICLYLLYSYDENYNSSFSVDVSLIFFLPAFHM